MRKIKLSQEENFTSEDEFVEFIKPLLQKNSGDIGIGDDAAVVDFGGQKLVATTDMLVENVHFQDTWVTPKYLGRKAALTNLSDMSAMGAMPEFALVSLIMRPNQWQKGFVDKLYQGLLMEFGPYKVRICGGNITQGAVFSITLMILGRVHKQPLLRSGAKMGDLLCVTGSLGRMASEVKQLLENKIQQAKELPVCRLKFAQTINQEKLPSSGLDISDGLALDLQRLCQASQVGAVVWQQNLPIDHNLHVAGYSKQETLRLVLSGGEDYELLFTLHPNKLELIKKLARTENTPFSVIGEITPQNAGLKLKTTSGKLLPLNPKGWDHIRA